MAFEVNGSLETWQTHFNNNTSSRSLAIITTSAEHELVKTAIAAHNPNAAYFIGASSTRSWLKGSGGTITADAGYVYHTFTSNGTFHANFYGPISALLVGGGGSGARSPSFASAGGGGGGGGVIQIFERYVNYESFSIVVGNGGSGSINQNGSDTTAFGAVAAGGGRGRSDSGNGFNGGCGGGVSSSNQLLSGGIGSGNFVGDSDNVATSHNGSGGNITTVTTNPIRGSGGGGAGGNAPDITTIGVNDTGATGSGAGGMGVPSSIPMTTLFWGGGGGGAARPGFGSATAPRGGYGGKGGGGGGGGDLYGGPGGGSSLTTGGNGSYPNGGNGAPNTGGGGGGSLNEGTPGSGGSGIVIIRYDIASLTTRRNDWKWHNNTNVNTAISNWTDGRPLLGTRAAMLSNGLWYDYSETDIALAVFKNSIPNAPTIGTAIPGNREAIVNWGVPVSNGTTITGYRIERSENLSNWTNAGIAGSGATFITISGLTSGTTYYFRVFTLSNGGDSAASSTSNAVTPFTNPNPPTITSVTAASTQVTVNWSAGASNGSTRTGYRIERSENLSTWINSTSASSGATSTSISGLTNGTPYYFRVVTLSNASDATSSPSSAITPFTTPNPPTITSVTAASTQVTVNWSAGASNGSTRTGYRIERSENLSTWINSTSASSGATSTSIDGLTNGTPYYFRVVTLSNASDATSSPSSAIRPNITPNAPSGLIVTTGNASAALSWAAPVPNGGSAITSYNVISDPLGGIISIDVAARTATVTNLTNGTAYTYRVTASNIGGTNILGTSSPSDPVQVTPFTTPSPPTNVRVTSRNTQATVSWTPPNNGGRAITSYSVTSEPGNFQLTTADGSTTTVTFSGLTNGTAYSFTVVAINVAGPSNASNPSDPITPIGAPVTNNKIAISNDGKVVALSSSYSDISKGRVYVYELSYNQVAEYNWIPLGLSSEIIIGLSNEDLFGWDLALSSNGRVVAGSSINSDASGINCGQVRLFELSNNEVWNQKGSVINGPIASSESGYSISLAGNGNRIAIGAWKDSLNGTNAGAVRVYDFSATINDWRQQGQTLTSDPGSYGGYATALSLDGLTLATGYLNVNNANNIINAGQVKTFNWSGTAWIDKGTIQGADISYLYFGRALKLSGNGNTIVIGAPGNILREGEGTAWVYRYQSGTTWTQLGQTILGISGGDDFGSSVAISNDGTIISVGSDNNSSNRGHVRVFAYSNNYWNQVSNTLSGKSASSRAGIHALSGDGTTLIQSNNTYNSVYGINKTLTVNAPMTSISGNLIVIGAISVNSLDISTNHVYSSNGYSYKMFGTDISSTVMKEYYSDVTSTRHLKVQIFGNGDIRNRNNSYKALSDSRLKENIVTSGPKLEDLLKVRVVDYKLKGADPSKYIGVLAQELEGVFPNLVTELEPSPKDIEDGNTIKYKAVNYSSFDAILIKSLQEQNAMLKNIEKKIIALEDE